MNHLKISTLGMILLFSATAVRAEGPSRRERLLWAAQAQDDVHRKDFEAAAQKLEKSVSAGASKKDLVVWLPVLGRCHEATKNYQKALAVYQKAYQLRPKLMERMLDLARLYA
ncbi:MAG: tetratricopeptide repeat protein, partial [Elusimicrobia bacterium]|nr:tetratricopeptide repeat protein [Elusimicrobiota bacterium]